MKESDFWWIWFGNSGMAKFETRGTGSKLLDGCSGVKNRLDWRIEEFQTKQVDCVSLLSDNYPGRMEI